jgi:O-antigen ligase
MSGTLPYNDLRRAWNSIVVVHGPWAAGFLAFLVTALPLAPNLVPIALILFIMVAVLQHRKQFQRPSRGVWSTPFPWLVGFFLLHVLGMAWTEDIGFGLFDLQIKAPLLVLPLLAMIVPAMKRDARDAILFIATLANALAVVICLFSALVRLLIGSEFGAAQELFSARFSFLIHPSYWAMYLCFALASWVLTPMHTWLPSAPSRAVLVLICLGVVLSGSKLGWILLALLLPLVLVLRWRDLALRRTLLALGAVTAGGLSLLVVVSPYARDRVQEAWRAAFSETVEDNAQTSSAVRRLTWSAAQELIAQDPTLGTGTGDIKNELLRIYDERGQAWAKEHRLNAHSQFLQSAACLGMFALLLLLILLAAPLFGRWKRDPLTMVFLAACALNWSVESMLEVQAGVVWTVVIAVVLFTTSEGNYEERKVIDRA